jgi:ABC-type multidrug transport system fused ATPase/permease subunit
MSTLVPLLHPYRRPVTGIVVVSVAIALVEAGVLTLIAAAAVALAASKHSIATAVVDWAPKIGTGLVIALAGTVVVLVARVWTTAATARLCRDSLETARNDLLDAYISGSWDRVALEQEGDLQTLLVANSTVLAQSTLAAVRGVTAAGSLLVLVAASFVISPAASAVVVAVLGGFLFAFGPVNRRSFAAGRTLATANLGFGRYLAQLQSNILEIQGLGVGERVLAAGRTQVNQVSVPFGQQVTYQTLAPVLVQTLLLVVLVAGLLVLDVAGGFSPAALGAACLILLRASVFGQQMQISVQQVMQAAIQIAGISEMRSRLSDDVMPAGTLVVDRVESIDVVGVDYAPRGDVRVLTGINLRIGAGRAVGVVGPSGSGKTTLLRLLLKLLSPDSGRIIVNDEHDLCDVSVDVWRRAVSFVPQQPQLLAGSVADNVRYYRPDISDDAVKRACQRAGLTSGDRDEIDPARRLDGFGGRISGGQRQRIAIARALVAEPQVLLLDEPTSALDERTEEAIRDTLDELKRDGTALVIVAHRPGLLSICDDVIRLPGHARPVEESEVVAGVVGGDGTS